MKPQINNPKGNNDDLVDKILNEDESIQINNKSEKKDRLETKEQKKQDKKLRKEKEKILENIPLSTLDLLPFKDYIDDGVYEKGYYGFELEDNTFMNLYEVVPYDYASMSDNEVLMHIIYWDRFYRTHSESIKLLSINLSVDTQPNIAYFKRKYNSTQNQLYREVIRDNINDFLSIKDRNVKKWYLKIFANTFEEIVKLNAQVRASLEQNRLVMQIDTRQKVILLNKISNPYNHSYKNIKEV